MEIKLLAAPLDMPEAIDYMEKALDKEDPLFIMVNLNRLLEDGFSEKQVREFISSISRGSLNSIHLMQPKDNQFFYTDKWLESLYRAWDSLEMVYWWQPSHIAEGSAEG
tara:strand:- start:34 stop:360 length:327 start_codon:yes stop_codon:yes gene_type:complete